MSQKSLMAVFNEDEIMLREGETRGEMFKIISGKAALYLHYGEENEYLIGMLSEGKCFGEVSLLAGKPSPYTVVAVEKIMIMRVTAEQFEGFVRDNAHNAVDIMKNMASRIVMLNTHLNMIADDLSEISKNAEGTQKQPDYKDITQKIRMYQLMGIHDGEFNSRV